jgi:hypothetical protein
MPGADASQYTRYLKSVVTSGANTFERGRKDRNALSQYVSRESAANSSGLRFYMPSLTKRLPIVGTQTVTVITNTVEGGGPATTTFTVTYDSFGPSAIPTVIIDGGGPGDR